MKSWTTSRVCSLIYDVRLLDADGQANLLASANLSISL